MKIYSILFTKYINIVCNNLGEMKNMIESAVGLSGSDGQPLPT